MSAIAYKGNFYSGLTTESKFLKFDNSKSNLDSTNTQDAIDELKENINEKAETKHSHAITDVTNLQTTLDGKASSTHGHKVAEISDLTASATELNYMDGVTRNVQTQINTANTNIAKNSTDIANLNSDFNNKDRCTLIKSINSGDTNLYTIDISDYKKLYVDVEISNNSNNFSFGKEIPIDIVKDAIRITDVGGGYGSSTSNTSCTIRLCKTQFGSWGILFNGTARTDATISLYGIK